VGVIRTVDSAWEVATRDLLIQFIARKLRHDSGTSEYRKGPALYVLLEDGKDIAVVEKPADH